MNRRAAPAILLLSLNAACGGGESKLYLGTGTEHFEEATSGLEIIQGPQGGYHVFLAVRAVDLGPELSIEYGIETPEIGFGVQENRLSLTPSSEGWERAALPCFVKSPESAGRQVIIFAKGTDGEGRSAEATLRTELRH